MKVVEPKSFTFEGGNRAVLLLHGFTGNTADVRMLGRYLQSKGYTSHSPLYKGHGKPPERFIESTPQDWWKNVIDGYNFLRDSGYKKVAAAGISLGGVFSLKLALELPLVGIVPMCAPMGLQNKNILRNMVLSYSREYKKHERKNDEQIEQELNIIERNSLEMIQLLQKLVADVRENLKHITVPTFVVQGRHDKVINLDSPEIIYHTVKTENKKLNWYEQSGHIITLEEERNQVEEDVCKFLDTLSWEEENKLDDGVSSEKAPQIWW
ncbi:alpha/beta hydrolase [Bacillus taeanensis]|uniref:Carboxylesterase n=1 Tax=Bacillus taeanensis TaxID=273032 RepID=A0A366XXA1_9BACI|nr:carboxylesterase [Bacillus taeanensis]RBW71020.1 carboxylesterase [Bacillus taeanensis]